MEGWSWISWTDRIWHSRDSQYVEWNCLFFLPSPMPVPWNALECWLLGLLLQVRLVTSTISWVVFNIEKDERNLSFSLFTHPFSLFHFFFIFLIFLFTKHFSYFIHVLVLTLPLWENGDAISTIEWLNLHLNIKSEIIIHNDEWMSNRTLKKKITIKMCPLSMLAYLPIWNPMKITVM